MIKLLSRMKSLQINKALPHLYLDLLKKSLTHYMTDNGYVSLHFRTHGKMKHLLYRLIETVLNPFSLELVKHNQFDPKIREVGMDWPANAETMIGLRRLDNIQYCMEDVLRKNIPGDVIETGVWRGGATIFMRAVLKAYNITNRTIWVADSFEGLPKTTDQSHKQDIEDHLDTYTQLQVSLAQVKKNFEKYGLLDHQVKFLKGWFKDTLPSAPIRRLAVLRLDGDMYESTMDALQALYPKLSVGGYLIIDDWCLPQCRSAVKAYRKQCGISEKIQRIDGTGVFWRKEKKTGF